MGTVAVFHRQEMWPRLVGKLHNHIANKWQNRVQIWICHMSSEFFTTTKVPLSDTSTQGNQLLEGNFDILSYFYPWLSGPLPWVSLLWLSNCTWFLKQSPKTRVPFLEISHSGWVMVGGEGRTSSYHQRAPMAKKGNDLCLWETLNVGRGIE